MALGLALGIDYALLMVTRFREWRALGLDPEAATVATLDTAGRAVLVAGGTVMVSMLGLFAVGLSNLNGTAVVTMIATLVVLAAAVTLFPALLGYLGRRIDRLRIPVGGRRAARVSADGYLVPAAGWARWSRLVVGTACSPPWPAWHSSWRWPRRSSACTSACPTPATTPRTRPTGRRTTCWPRDSGRAGTGRCSSSRS